MAELKGKITAEQAKNLNDNWTNLRASANRSAAGQEDNRSSWYSLEDMQNFLNQIKNDNQDVNGVRFYLGVNITKQDPSGLTTIFMVPTQNLDGKNKDIKGATGMDMGNHGDPPGANYPQ